MAGLQRNVTGEGVWVVLKFLNGLHSASVCPCSRDWNWLQSTVPGGGITQDNLSWEKLIKSFITAFMVCLGRQRFWEHRMGTGLSTPLFRVNIRVRGRDLRRKLPRHYPEGPRIVTLPVMEEAKKRYTTHHYVEI